MKRISILLVLIVCLSGLSAAMNLDSIRNVIENDVESKSELRHQHLKDSLLLTKLSPADLMELKKQELEVEKQRIVKDGNSDMPLGPAGIVIICMLPFAMVVIIILINSRARSIESKRRYDIYMKSLEMGQTVPDHFFELPVSKRSPSSNLKRGVICLAVGLALVVSYLVMKQNGFLIGGIIPAFIGVGYLIVFYLEKPKSDQA